LPTLSPLLNHQEFESLPTRPFFIFLFLFFY
jgi:hypothetical protein